LVAVAFFDSKNKSMQGTIYLYDRSCELISVRQYKCPSDRHKIIEAWKHQIGDKIGRMHFQIAPDARPDLVKITGTNNCGGALKKRYVAPKEKPQTGNRPAAVYSNSKSLYNL